MLSKSDLRIPGAFVDVAIEIQLRGETSTGENVSRLRALGLEDGARRRQNARGCDGVDEKNAVLVGEYKIPLGDFERPESDGPERVFVAGVEPGWAGRERSIAEDRKVKLHELRRVTVGSPNHDAGETQGARFENYQVADACFVQAAAVVDDEDVAGL
jgi:hypothetical protein